MATKRRPLRPNLGGTAGSPSSSGSNMNFRPGGPDITRSEARGTRPTAAPTSIREILVMGVIHLCKKTIFFNTDLKVALYLGSLFVISVIGDFVPFPKTYFARSDNLFNQYFVKIGWGWTLLFVVPFLVLSAYTITCGDHKRMLRHHFPRIVIATFFWFFWTKLFNVVENSYGRCTTKGYATKSSCLKAGHLWKGFDISGHAFILIHSSLVLIEEARPIIRWETIKEHIRNERHNRSTAENSGTNPLRTLNEEQMRSLQFLYKRLTPIIRTLFIGMAALQLLWDIMLVGTMLYYHRMIEKVISGIIAILTWYFTYRFWYPTPGLLPEAPGNGSFSYQREIPTFPFKRPSHLSTGAATTSSGSNSSRTNLNGKAATTGVPRDQQIPTFMGMPLFTSPKAASAAANLLMSDQQKRERDREQQTLES
uniref:Acyl-coenzyme A diphosphatase FITM2 n=2 Tax=Drosophila melanogaster TaxID=7227 RepID=FITM2_DROME|nr:Fat storage inducing transmembrane protein, isoform A [Drosophila melanogaster]Q9VRJ2.1 RecName: Full=Acyl-coenzyme A diphosphatase FITM2; AltName: Full=Fat storage-inducing transmembrane protein; AltName: Full=Fat storage-inducing transmembrane protein 2; AltName: Full=Fat-inducing protein 2 [Drosophila melanogaster]AAF50803.1 Fat storage inducing transmembrane protein, isoform A [Drosophila melanogaster]|eukprot:NP_647944.2 Fat storage inducing transmembrane protein, isoform A [Drosophila melanogaster]